MKVSVVYANKQTQPWINLTVAEDCSVADAIAQSGLLRQFPEINLSSTKIGIFGKLTKTNAILKEGDRIEIYQPIIRVLDDDDDDD